MNGLELIQFGFFFIHCDREYDVQSSDHKPELRASPGSQRLSILDFALENYHVSAHGALSKSAIVIFHVFGALGNLHWVPQENALGARALS